MKGCGRACVVQLILWAGFAAAFFTYARSVRPVGTEIWPVSIGIGLVVTMALLLADSIVRTALERRMLRRAERGIEPRDGAWTTVCGTIRSSAPLRAPLSGEPAVAYEYSITRREREHRTVTVVRYFHGKALAESSIVTGNGPVRLLAVPALEVEPAELDARRALANARDHVRRATFEPRDSAAKRVAVLEREWADGDGFYRSDRRYSASAELDESFRFEEHHIRPGDPVCVFGVYSSERRAVVLDTRWGRPPRLMRVGAAEAGRALRGRMIRYAIGSLVLLAAAAWGAMTYLGPAGLQP